eukprot:SRR837773.7333.p2 GENE.SRR837773.7333~~SRR837773.7333.p2  ORF type:complete len:128 (-),score=6.62 SRR837773.7333:124-507(-)
MACAPQHGLSLGPTACIAQQASQVGQNRKRVRVAGAKSHIAALGSRSEQLLCFLKAPGSLQCGSQVVHGAKGLGMPRAQGRSSARQHMPEQRLRLSSSARRLKQDRQVVERREIRRMVGPKVCFVGL